VGAHVNAIGAIGPERQELAQDVFPRAAAVAADLPASVRRLSAEFMRYYGDGPGNWDEVRPISALIAEGWRRPAGADLTLFKAMGMGVSDLALAVRILEGARAAGLGRPMPHPARARPRLMTRQERSMEP
jgi:ornithine cyclodeaminase